MSETTFAALLERLEVPRGGLLYVQSSTDWLAKAGFEAGGVLRGLREWSGAHGTLAMPSYPSRIPHLDYLSTTPTFDVRRTPAAIGLIPEVFRRGPRTRRSLDPDFSIAAEGEVADAITASPLEADPFGRASTYERLLAGDAHLLGLGVSLNTNSFIHVIDSRLQLAYPRPPYLGTFATTVVDYDGRSRPVERRALAPEFQRLTRPGAVAAALSEQPSVFRRETINGAQFFRWSLLPWSRWCQSHAENAIGQGRWPCWLTEIEGACGATS